MLVELRHIFSFLSSLEKKKENEVGRISAMRSILEEAYGLFALFYGSIKTLLAKDLNGDFARSSLRAFFPDYLSGVTTLVSILL